MMSTKPLEHEDRLLASPSPFEIHDTERAAAFNRIAQPVLSPIRAVTKTNPVFPRQIKTCALAS